MTLSLIDVNTTNTHGGSMRYIVGRKNTHKINKRVNKILAQEQENKLDDIDSCLKFKRDCELSKSRIKNLINCN